MIQQVTTSEAFVMQTKLFGMPNAFNLTGVRWGHKNNKYVSVRISLLRASIIKGFDCSITERESGTTIVQPAWE